MPDEFTQENLRPTPILDIQNSTIENLVARLSGLDGSPLAYVQAAHKMLCREVLPIYTLDEQQPASKTLRKGLGSCSQRFACLEALARARSIPTRVRGLWIAGRFWSPRFRLTRMFIPRRVLLAWPQFYIEKNWIGAESVFNTIDDLAREHPARFANDGESLFDAVGHTAIDFDGRTTEFPGAQCNLSQFVLEEAGTFPTRDALFAAHPLLQRSLRGIAFEWVFGGRKSL